MLSGPEFDKRVQELPNPRLSPEEWEKKVEMPSKAYRRDFKERALSGKELSYLEARMYMREKLTCNAWKVTFYEVYNFPQIRYFENGLEAKAFFNTLKKGKPIMAQQAVFYAPAYQPFGTRAEADRWEKPEVNHGAPERHRGKPSPRYHHY